MTVEPEQASDRALLADPRWFPRGYDPRRRLLDFAYAPRDYWAGKRFLDARWLTERLPRRELAGDWVASELAGVPPAEINVIWHTSFCCSTLIADLLEKPGQSLALREPEVLANLALSRRVRIAPTETPEASTFHLLARRFGTDAHVTVKPSNFANNLIAAASAATAGKMLFLYSGLESFMLAIARKGHDGRSYVHNLFGGLAVDGELPPAITPEMQLSDAKLAALSWHMQMAAFRRALEELGPSSAATLDSADFLADPLRAITALDAFFGLGLGEAHIAGAVGGPLMQRHAKELTAFNPAQRKAEEFALRAKLGAALDEVMAWSGQFFPASPRDAALPHPLVKIEKVLSS